MTEKTFNLPKCPACEGTNVDRWPSEVVCVNCVGNVELVRTPRGDHEWRPIATSESE